MFATPTMFFSRYFTHLHLFPSNESLPTVKDPNSLVTLIDIDIDDYIRKHDNRLVKKTLTIPSRLNELAKENNINFSRVLVDALQKKLS